MSHKEAWRVEGVAESKTKNDNDEIRIWDTGYGICVMENERKGG